MSVTKGTQLRRSRGWQAVSIITLGWLLLTAGCSGSTGSQGVPGQTGAIGPQGPTGTTGPVTALNIATAATITGTITSVTVAGQPVVKFMLVDQNGEPLKGLPASSIGWVIAKLTPGTNGMSSQWTAYT